MRVCVCIVYRFRGESSQFSLTAPLGERDLLYHGDEHVISLFFSLRSSICVCHILTCLQHRASRTSTRPEMPELTRGRPAALQGPLLPARLPAVLRGHCLLKESISSSSLFPDASSWAPFPTFLGPVPFSACLIFTGLCSGRRENAEEEQPTLCPFCWVRVVSSCV